MIGSNNKIVYSFCLLSLINKFYFIKFGGNSHGFSAWDLLCETRRNKKLVYRIAADEYRDRMDFAYEFAQMIGVTLPFQAQIQHNLTKYLAAPDWDWDIHMFEFVLFAQTVCISILLGFFLFKMTKRKRKKKTEKF